MPFFDNSSKHQVDRQHTVWCNPHENNFWIAKSESLELVCPAAPTPDLSIILCVLSDLSKLCVMLIMCLQPCPIHPYDRACQEVTQSGTGLMWCAGGSERLCAVNLD